MTSRFKPLALYATDVYKLSSLLVQRVLLSKPVGNLTSYKQKTKQLLLDQSRTQANVAAVKLLHWDKEFGLVQYYGIQEYARRWWQSRSSTTTSLSSTAPSSPQVSGDITVTKSKNKVARVAFMITSEQRQKLSVNLGYTQQDIRTFKPIEALLLIENNVKKTSEDDNIQYNFRDQLKKLVDENEKLMEKQTPPSSSTNGVRESAPKVEKTQTITPEDADQAHVKADVAMALLSAEKEDEPKVEDASSSSKETDIVDDTSISAVALVDEVNAQTQESYSNSKPTHETSALKSSPNLVTVTPNDSTELHMKPDVAAAYINSQNEESESGISDVNDTDEEADGPCWYEVVVNNVDANEKDEKDQVVVALFSTKKEAMECVDIKKRLASGDDKHFSVRRRWNV